MNKLTERLKLLVDIIADDGTTWTLDTSQWNKKMWKKYGDKLREIYEGN